MGYRKQTYTAGIYKVVEKRYTRRPPRKGRGKKEKPTPEAMKEENRKRRVRKVQLLIMANFDAREDMFIDLTYRPGEGRPKTIQEAKEVFSRFIRKVKRKAERAGAEIKWIVTTEKGVRGACHHHLIVSGNEAVRKTIAELWTWGKASIQYLYDDGDGFHKLAEYMVKAEKDGEKVKDEGAGVSYSHSRNLTQPTVKEETVEAVAWAKNPKPEKGYVILKETVENGENQVTGFKYQRYVMKRIGT